MTATTSSRTSERPHLATVAGLLVAVALAAFNLRPAIVAIGPLADRIQDADRLGPSAVSLLTTLPLVCLGVFAAAAAPVARRMGFERGVLLALALIVIGSLVRLAQPTVTLFAGSVVAGCGIAVGNVLVPALIKQQFADRLGPVMTLYSVVLQLGATLASGLTVPLGLALGLGWRSSLALWGVPALLAFVAWLPWGVRRAAYASEPGPRRRVWTSRLGWSAALFIGLQSAVFFSMSAWLPALLQDAGLAVDRAGLMLSVVALLGILGGLPMPLLATRRPSQRPLVAAVACGFTVGLVGLLIAPAAMALLWAAALGLAQGAGLSLALTLFTLRGRGPDAAAQLSGMAQTAGYVIAAAGPLAVGFLRGVTGGWTVPLVLLLVALVPFTISGWAVSRPRFIDDETEVIR